MHFKFNQQTEFECEVRIGCPETISDFQHLIQKSAGCHVPLFPACFWMSRPRFPSGSTNGRAHPIPTVILEATYDTLDS
eukprot:3693393-Rhodomonas_salina.1